MTQPSELARIIADTMWNELDAQYNPNRTIVWHIPTHASFQIALMRAMIDLKVGFLQESTSGIEENF